MIWDDNLIYYKQTCDNVACFNADLDLSIAYLSDFLDSAEKHDAILKHAIMTPDRIEDKRIDLTHDKK